MSIPDPIVLLDARARYVHPAFQMSRASTKTVFDATGRLVTVPANAIGWDHDPATGQSRGYLAEPSATNLLLHSNDLTQGEWTKGNASITANAITGPDGNGMAKLVEDTSGSPHIFRQDFSAVENEAVVVSAIAKAGERSACRLQVRQASDNSIHFSADFVLTGSGNTQNLVMGGSGQIIGAEVRYIGNGFYRIWLSGFLGEVSDLRLTAYLVNSAGTAVYQGDGTSGLYLGYCQAEEGSYPTSYIETGGSTGARIDDQMSFLDVGDAGWFNPRAGTMLLDMWYLQRISNAIFWVLERPGVTNLYLRGSGGNPRLVTENTDVSQEVTILSASSFAPQSRYFAAVSWDADGVYSSANGGSVVDGDMGELPGGNLHVGWGSASWTRRAHANFARLVYYPQRISNAALQSLTALQE